jgi:hypothetical protein
VDYRDVKEIRMMKRLRCSLEDRIETTIRVQPATLSSYRIAADGRLEHVQTHDIETNGLTQWWSGFVPMTV